MSPSKTTVILNYGKIWWPPASKTSHLEVLETESWTYEFRGKTIQPNIGLFWKLLLLACPWSPSNVNIRTWEQDNMKPWTLHFLPHACLHLSTCTPSSKTQSHQHSVPNLICLSPKIRHKKLLVRFMLRQNFSPATKLWSQMIYLLQK
jgi:hypothetical protein